MLKKPILKAGLAFAFVIIASSAYAKVTLKNGNFFIGYTDIIYNGGLEPQVQRVYNSKSGYEGMFGKGWGSEYEAKLSVFPDASVVIKEFGGGAENRFVPVSGLGSDDVAGAVKQIAEAARKSGSYTPGYDDKLKQSLEFRNQEWEKFHSLGLVKPKELPNGTQLKSHKFSYQYVTKVKEGYVRASENGKTETFNTRGQLVEIRDKSGNFIKFTYDPKGLLAKLQDNQNRKILFSFNAQNLLEKVQGENNKVATYKYNSNSELISSKDVDGNAYTYKYSSDGRHNLTEIGYADKTTLQVAYYGRDLKENVKSVKERDGTLTEYGYEYGKDSVKVSVKVKDASGQSLSTGQYEYYTKINPKTGEEFNERLVTVLDGDRTETIYHPDFGAPTLVKRGKDETRFEYDIKGRVLKKDTPTELTQYVYDPKAGKVSKVTRTSKVLKKVTYWAEFSYDPSTGKIVSAKNSDNKGVKLVYNRAGQIATIVDHEKRRIDFKYNENSRPIELKDPKKGTVKFTYNNSGEIKDLQSPQGSGAAMDILHAFQSYLDILRPSGVTWGAN